MLYHYRCKLHTCRKNHRFLWIIHYLHSDCDIVNKLFDKDVNIGDYSIVILFFVAQREIFIDDAFGDG